jgi:hypothetical protein
MFFLRGTLTISVNEAITPEQIQVSFTLFPSPPLLFPYFLSFLGLQEIENEATKMIAANVAVQELKMSRGLCCALLPSHAPRSPHF